MLAEILNIFWKEKLRFVQFCFDSLKSCDSATLNQKNESTKKSIRWAIQQMIASDSNFNFYLPISVRFSSFFFLGSFKDQEIERDLDEIRDKYTPPAFPPQFWEISIQEAEELKILSEDEEVRKLCESWKEVLVRLEAKLAKISEKEAYRKRYTSLTGIHTISGAINNSTEYCHYLWNLYIKDQI
ncbi:MAG: hypothetical protein MUF77_04810 [Leptospira sp.]|jgi:hypothetical protein|nr:hypothetical protein [Leptospira sp.]